MRPLRLILDGFGSYRHLADADFTDVDFFALTGPTGSGKSTLIDGLCFALYGTVPRWGNVKEIAYALAPSATSCRVCLVFEAMGARYAAVRSLTRDKRGQVHTKAARLERLDPAIPADAPIEEILQATAEQLAEGPDQVTARVADLLGLSYEHFTQSVLLPQGRFAEFLRATPSERQKLLVELLAFGVYKEIGQRARERAQRAGVAIIEAQRLRGELAGATEEAETAAAARVTALAGLAEAADELLAALTKAARSADDAAAQAAAVREETGRLAALRMPADVPGLAERIIGADALIAAADRGRDEAEQVEAEATRTRAGLPDKAWLERCEHLYAQRQEQSALLGRQREALDASEAGEARLAGRLAAAEAELDAASSALAGARDAHAAAVLAQSLRPGDVCPVCLRRVTEQPHHAAPADLTAAAARADAAAKDHRHARAAHRDAGQAVAGAYAAVSATERRLAEIAGNLAGAQAEAEVDASLAAIAGADDAADQARRLAAAARAAVTAAQRARAALTAEEQAAWAALRQSRDRVVGLGAPPASEADLATAWQALVGWAAAQRGEREARLPELEAAAAALRRQAGEQAAGLRALLAEHGISAGGATDPAAVPVLVARHRSRAEKDLEIVRRDRKQAAKLDEQIAARQQEQQVAAMLGNLLRANSFEGWLCSEALDSLVTEASATLMALSGDQYQLDRGDRNDLVVIDYNDAGTRRPVHTLSGGETFQASLALALALSHQVIGLSAGMRDLNSMFLDEGFGTLDADTLDTVATTLERLVANSGRMVGIVTHVAGLADRVPVRFVISREGATSVLRKERV
ncbi:MAG TPA: SMC family ATPase [Streptosporangiaceae bacterium]|nr:SMC family ATPase [Streptosporangiaceae bacterium]